MSEHTHAQTSCRSMGRALGQIQSILPPSFLRDSTAPDKPKQVIKVTAPAALLKFPLQMNF